MPITERIFNYFIFVSNVTELIHHCKINRLSLSLLKTLCHKSCLGDPITYGLTFLQTPLAILNQADGEVEKAEQCCRRWMSAPFTHKLVFSYNISLSCLLLAFTASTWIILQFKQKQLPKFVTLPNLDFRFLPSSGVNIFQNSPRITGE